MNAAQAVGIVAQLVGVVITVRAVWVTWHEHPTGEPFTGPVGPWVRARSSDAARQLHLRRGGSMHEATAHSRITVTGTAEARLSWGPLPLEPEAFRAELTRRLDVLHAASQDADGEIRSERRAREAADDELSSALAARINEVERMVHGVATEGLRGQVAGAALVVVGVVCQVFGSL